MQFHNHQSDSKKKLKTTAQTAGTTSSTMASFEEDSRKRLVSMSHGKANKPATKDDLTRAVREDRERRALERKREQCALKIQQNYRGYISRKHEKLIALQDFLKKCQDFQKLEQLLSAKQPKFAARQSCQKLIRMALFVADGNSPELMSGLLLVLNRMKSFTGESFEFEEQFRLSRVLRLLICSPHVKSHDVDKFLVAERLYEVLPQALVYVQPTVLIRAAMDQTFIPLAERFLSQQPQQKQQTEMEIADHELLFTDAFLIASEISPSVTGSIISKATSSLRLKLYLDLVHSTTPGRKRPAKTRLDRLSRFWSTTIKPVGMSKNDSIFLAIATSLPISSSPPTSSSSSSANFEERQVVGPYAEAMMIYSDSKTSPEVFQFVCDPKRVAHLIYLASLDSSTNQLFSICSFYNQALERFRDS
jgi:hypothetical protein